MNCPYCQANVSPSSASPQGATVVACMDCLNPLLITPDDAQFRVQRAPGALEVPPNAQQQFLGGQLIKTLRDSIDSLPVLPDVSYKVANAINDPGASVQDLATVISEDPVVAGGVLEVANSAVYGGLSQITDIHGGCSRLGMRNVANTVQVIVVNRLQDAAGPQFSESARKLSRHAIATAHYAYEIAIMNADPQPDTLFLGGLLHDVGRIGLLSMAARNQDGPLVELSRSPALLLELLDSYHRVAGLIIAQSWNLPDQLRSVIFFHRDPENTPKTDHHTAVHMVALANLVAHVSGFDSGNPREDSPLASSSCSYLGLSDIQLATLRVNLDDRLQPLFEIAS